MIFRGRTIFFATSTIIFLQLVLTPPVGAQSSEYQKATPGTLLLSTFVLESTVTAPPRDAWTSGVLGVDGLAHSGRFHGFLVTQSLPSLPSAQSIERLSLVARRDIIDQMAEVRAAHLGTPLLVLAPYDEEPSAVGVDWSSRPSSNGTIWGQRLLGSDVVVLHFPRESAVEIVEAVTIVVGSDLNLTADRYSELVRIREEQDRLRSNLRPRLSESEARSSMASVVQLDSDLDRLSAGWSGPYNSAEVELKAMFPLHYAEAVLSYRDTVVLESMSEIERLRET